MSKVQMGAPAPPSALKKSSPDCALPIGAAGDTSCCPPVGLPPPCSDSCPRASSAPAGASSAVGSAGGGGGSMSVKPRCFSSSLQTCPPYINTGQDSITRACKDCRVGTQSHAGGQCAAERVPTTHVQPELLWWCWWHPPAGRNFPDGSI